MLPLLANQAQSTNAPHVKSNWAATSKYRVRALCVLALLAVICVIGYLFYFNVGHSSSSLAHSNPAKSMLTTSTDIDDQTKKGQSGSISKYYKANGEDDLIENMPDLILKTCNKSPTKCGFNQYSGYLLATNNRELHYWFLEADVEGNGTSADKPVFVWTNGGPGCSGMDGLLTEHGPWRVMDDLTIEYNPYSWNREVNIVYLEQPFGVGFSSTSGKEKPVIGDMPAAADMDAAIRNFLVKFPRYANNKIYLTAESWGGHYVPITSYTILQNNDAGVSPTINFGGFLLGNPYTNQYENAYGFVGSLYGHGLMKSKDWLDWMDECWDNEYAIDNSRKCSAIYTRVYIASQNANVYAVDYPQCPRDIDWKGSTRHQKYSHVHRRAQKAFAHVLSSDNYEELGMKQDKETLTSMYHKLLNNENIISSDLGLTTVGGDEYLPCIEYNMARWLNQKKTQKALNVKPGEWEMCNDKIFKSWPDSDYERYIEKYYTKLAKEYLLKENLKMTVYSGDDDSVCALTGTQFWLDRWEGFEANTKMEWEPWPDADNQLGGYYTQYVATNQQLHGNVVLHFITVRSAGHMVPTTEPSRALTLLQKFLYEFTSTPAS